MKLLLAAVLALLAQAGIAQYWKALGRGTIGPTEVQTLYGDSVSERLLAGGTFMWIKNEHDTVLGDCQAAWNGTRWDSIASPISGSNSAQQTHWYLRFEGRLYACGFFDFQLPNSSWNTNLARLNEEGTQWEALGCSNPPNSEIATLVPKEPDTTLYATGYKGTVCGFPESCVFRYDGSAFHTWPPFEDIPYDPGNYVGYVFDYQGMTYMTGTLQDPVGPGTVTFLRYTGTTWEHVPGWNTQSPIKEILIRNGILYVAGAFHESSGGPGNLVASFDGENWDDLDGGLAYYPIPMNGVAMDLEWYHGKLLVSGFFNRAGGAECSSIAQWDGTQWCGFPGEIRWQFNGLSLLYDMAVWRDSLYVCGGINTVDGDTMRQVIQWIGGDAIGNCSTTAIDQTVGTPTRLIIRTLPGSANWEVEFPGSGPWVLLAYNSIGQSVGQWHASSNKVPVDLDGEPPGLYLLRAESATGQRLGTKILRP